MTFPRFRWWACLCLVFGLVLVDVTGAQSIRERRSRTGAKANSQKDRKSNSQSQPQRTNQLRTNSTSPKAPLPVVEKADPEARRAFLKLMEANWVWSPAHKKDEVPVGDCYFRKSFKLDGKVESGEVHIACDNAYELYVNGQPAGKGADWRNMDVHDITKLLKPGDNILAIKATNTDPGAAGLVARVVIKEAGGTFESYSTDATWRTSVKEYVDWTKPRLDDSEWVPAKVYGLLGAVLPWGDEIVIGREGTRFVHDPEFRIERLVTDQQAGSLIAMAFTANGDIIASREGGGLQLIRDADGDRNYETVVPFCDEVRNIQGILPLGKQVFAVGDGPAGGALYRISDADGDGKGESVTPIVKYHGVLGEHGPHTVRLGPDGYLYLLSGNFTQVDGQFDSRSPYGAIYEGDLLKPRYEDPNGHAVGVPAPGGNIVRTDAEGSFVELLAGGFRNPYDFCFNSDGEIFTYDADMEWDIGSPWYRPTRVIHAPPGGEFGWRSGWAKWPAYYVDGLPPLLEMGVGSPTGVVYYDHTAFPERLRHTLFIGDWATGQIHAVKLQRNGATYTAKMSTFIKGRPLNVTGLDVGPDGALYFCTGGRGTDGGVYRVSWNKPTPPQDKSGTITQALRQPQLHSDWSRMSVASVRRTLGDRWQTELEGVIANAGAPAHDRQRAIDLLTYFGPAPSPELLGRLARDADAGVRVRAARLMGTAADPAYSDLLTTLLDDRDAWVRRVACEAIAHRGENAPVKSLVRLLDDQDRFVAFAARRALEKCPAHEWQEVVLSAQSPRVFLRGTTALLVSNPSSETARKALARCEQMLARDLSDESKLDLLRVVQLALVRGELGKDAAPNLAQQLLRSYPTKNAEMNRELVKLLAFMQPRGTARALAMQLESDIPDAEKMHISAYAPRVTDGWQTADKLAMLRYYEKVRALEGGHSLKGYVEFFARDFFAKLTPAEQRQLIAAGERYPTSTLSVLAAMAGPPTPDVLAEIRALDNRVAGMEGEPIARLRVGIVAVLGGSGEEASLAYLREQYYNHPERRAPVAMSLTQHPDGENWPILLDSLRTVEGEPARTILAALAKVDRRPETSEPYRNTILVGLRLQAAGGGLAVRLLEKWIGPQSYAQDAPVADQLAAWQGWYATTFPNERPAELPKESHPNKWTYEELLSYLDGPEAKLASPSRGAVAFKEAQCINCHRFKGNGEGIGPDLTTVSQRFQRREILESIVYPNQVVSDQYASQTVVAGGATYTGIVAMNADRSMNVLQSDGQKVHVAAEDVESIEPSKMSAMPEGLLNRLSLEQVADLFAYLLNAPEPSVAGREAAPAR